MIVRVVPPLKVVKVQVTAMEYDFWTMRESPFHQLSDFQCIFLFAFGEVKNYLCFRDFFSRPYSSASCTSIDSYKYVHVLVNNICFCS